MADPLVQAVGLTKTYRSVQALDAVSLEIPPGAVGLLGPNGAGKTTLIRLMLGLTNPTAGSLTVLGLPSPDAKVEIRRRTGYSPENDSHFPGMSAIDGVAYAASLSGLPGADAFKRAHELLDFVRLDEARFRPVETYSTGMKQRVKIAQALVHDPEFVVLDEPTSGLDATGRIEVLDLIRDLARRERPSVVLSTHILEDVERVCSHAVIMHQGRCIGSGAVKDLVGEGDQYEVRFLGDAGGFRTELERRHVSVTEIDGTTFGLSAGSGPVFEAAAAAGITIRHYAKRRRTLDEAFLRLVG